MKASKRIETEYDPMLSFRLPVEHRDAIESEASRRYLKTSDIMREIVREWYEHTRSAKASSA